MTRKIAMEILRPAIESFFQRITAEQQALLKSGAADEATQVMLAKMILELISILAESILPQDKTMSKDCVLSRLGDTLPRTLALVLDVSIEITCVNTISLTNLIAEEVAKQVNSSSAEDASYLESKTLAEMVSHACQMFKTFMGKMKCTPRPSPRPEIARSSSCKLTKFRYLDRPANQDTSVTDGQQRGDDSFVAATTKLAQKIIRQELREITRPLLDDMHNTEQELLQSDTENIAAQIVQSISDEVESLASACPEPKKERKLKLKGLAKKIKTFFATQFAKLSIHRCATELKKKFFPNSEAKNKDEIQEFMSDFTSTVLSNGDGKQKALLARLKDISSGKDLVFTKALCDLLYDYIMEGIPDVVPQSLIQSEYASIREMMEAQIHRKVWCYFGLLRWWLATYAGIHVGRATDALKNTELAKSTLTASKQLKAQIEQKKHAVLLIVEKLVARIFRKVRVNCKFENPKVVVERVFEKIWAEVEGVEIEITPKMINEADKAIHKDLCKKWGSATGVLVSMILNQTEFDEYIASAIENHLKTPPKGCCFTTSKFFCCFKSLNTLFYKR